MLQYTGISHKYYFERKKTFLCINWLFLKVLNFSKMICPFELQSRSGVFAHLRVQGLISQLTKILLN